MRRFGPTAVALAVVLLAALIAPATAGAVDLNPLPDLPSLNPGDYIVDGFKALVRWIFGDVDSLGKHLVNLLLAVPILTDKNNFARLNEYRGYIQGGCWGILALGFVIASMRYWLSSGTGVYDGLIGFGRTAGAIGMLLVFPVAFDQVSRIVNALTAALVSTPLVAHGLRDGLVGTVSTTALSGGGIAMLIGLAAIVMALVLLIVKVIVTALLAVLFVASPLAISLWPIEELAWAPKTLLSAMGALFAFPILWAICFGTFAVLNADALFPGDHGDILVSILSPLIALASLIIAFRLPFAVLNQAMGAGLAGHGGRVYRAAQSVRGLASGGGAAPAVPTAKVHPQQGRMF
jgi:hypothetical protein